MKKLFVFILLLGCMTFSTNTVFANHCAGENESIFSEVEASVGFEYVVDYRIDNVFVITILNDKLFAEHFTEPKTIVTDEVGFDLARPPDYVFVGKLANNSYLETRYSKRLNKFYCTLEGV